MQSDENQQLFSPRLGLFTLSTKARLRQCLLYHQAGQLGK